jgi:hypothetical protein
LEEEIIMASVSKKIESTIDSTSVQLSAAKLKISTAVGSAFTSWQMQLALPNCSADIQRQYYDLVVKQQIEAITCNDAKNTQYSNVTTTDLKKDYAASTTPKSHDNDVIINSDIDDDQCNEVSEEVLGTIQPPKFNMDQ